ncbi:MAG: uncharacterized protein A8A55_0501 [Amphiamblys sp. WSBS2006]|nr:MAG: uncharacterized protein A8A55_0501 [Amphiamblys sp. WSBS2006]
MAEDVKRISLGDWTRRMESLRTSPNNYIKNYFLYKGYYSEYTSYISEAGGFEDESARYCLGERDEITREILCGRTNSAIRKIIALEPELLEESPKLLFELKRQVFVGMIEEDSPAALSYAQEELGPIVLEQEDLLDSLEDAMALLFYPDKKVLASLATRKELAERVNLAVLAKKKIQLPFFLNNLAGFIDKKEKILEKEIKLPKMKQLFPFSLAED